MKKGSTSNNSVLLVWHQETKRSAFLSSVQQCGLQAPSASNVKLAELWSFYPCDLLPPMRSMAKMARLKFFKPGSPKEELVFLVCLSGFVDNYKFNYRRFLTLSNKLDLPRCAEVDGERPSLYERI